MILDVGFLFSFGSCERFSFQFDLGFDRWIVHRARGIKPSSLPLFDARGLYKLIMRRRKEEKLCLIDFFSVLVPYIVLLLVMVDVL